MKLYNPFRHLTTLEWYLWGTSLAVVTLSFFVGGGTSRGLLSLAASLLGVTALIFVAKGDVTGQFLTVIFSLLYALVSWTQGYYGEMITYLFMSTPAAIFSIVSWLRHPYGKDHAEVRMVHLTKKAFFTCIVISLTLTVIFYFVLKQLNTSELLISTLSVTTSLLAASLLFLRSPCYALAYATNDVVLIILWIMASIKAPHSLSMVACFLMFLLNDLYAFFNWRRLRHAQNQEKKTAESSQ